MSDLKPRLITAFVLIALILGMLAAGALWAWGQFLMLTTAFIFNCICGYEMARMASKAGNSSTNRGELNFLSYAAIFILPSILALYFLSTVELLDSFRLTRRALCIPALGFFCAATLYAALTVCTTREAPNQMRSDMTDALFGLLLIGFGGTALMSITMLEGASGALLWFLLVVCFNDAAAYFVGRQVGGPRLAPYVSPKKTISGSLGGLIVGCAVGVGMKFLLPLSLSHFGAVLLCLCIVIVAQLGDLIKSYVKRAHGVKDSGTILPGHGGFLDRIDGVLMAAPILLFWFGLSL